MALLNPKTTYPPQACSCALCNKRRKGPCRHIRIPATGPLSPQLKLSTQPDAAQRSRATRKMKDAEASYKNKGCRFRGSPIFTLSNNS